MVTPTAGVTWLSENTANFYYGTLDAEVARGAIDYKPDAVTIPHVGVNFMRFFGEQWTMIAFLRYSFLPMNSRTVRSWSRIAMARLRF